MPPTRGRPIALKLLALLLVPLLSLAGLWAFAASLTGVDGLRLLAINDLAANVATPSEQVNIELQNERLVSVEFLVTGRGADAVAEQRRKTDRAVTTYRKLSGGMRDLSPDAAGGHRPLQRHRGRVLPHVRRHGPDARHVAVSAGSCGDHAG
jgi:hypothetical protein